MATRSASSADATAGLAVDPLTSLELGDAVSQTLLGPEQPP